MTLVLADWVGRIVVLLVAAAMVELALPAGGLRRYVEVVLGLVVLVTVLRPVLGWLGADLGAAATDANARFQRHLQAAAGSWLGTAGPGSGPRSMVQGPSGPSSPAGAGGGRDWFEGAVDQVFADRVAEAVRRGLADALGVDAAVEVELGEPAGGAAEPAWEPPPLARVMVRVLPGGKGQAPPTSAAMDLEPVVVRVPPVDGPSLPAAGAPPAGASHPGSAPDLPARIRSWVAETLGIEADRVTVVFIEEVEP
ncbi:MAG TPA: stage III sporulation protein AF [Bacillota bacterium]